MADETTPPNPTTTPQQVVDPQTGIAATQHDGRIWFKSGGKMYSAGSVAEALESDPTAAFVAPDEVQQHLDVRAQSGFSGQAKTAAKQVASHAIDVATGLFRYPAIGMAALANDEKGLKELQDLGGEQVLENTYGIFKELSGGGNAEAASRKYHEATKAQLEANPTTAEVAGIVGDVAPAIATGGLTAAGKLAGGTLTEEAAGSLLGKAAETTAGKAAKSALVGAIQGAGFGEQAASEQAYISDDPLTRQKVWAAGAMGGLFGGAIGGGVSLGGSALKRAVRPRLSTITGPVEVAPKSSLAEAIGDSSVTKEAAQDVADRAMAAEGVEAAPGLGEKLHSLLTDVQASTTGAEKEAVGKYGLGAILDPKTRVKALDGIRIFRDRPQIIEGASSEIADSMKTLQDHAENGVFQEVRDLGMKRNAWEKLIDPAKAGEQVDAARAFAADTRVKLEGMLADTPEGGGASSKARSFSDIENRIELPKADEEAIYNYTVSSYKGINDSLRDPERFAKKWDPYYLQENLDKGKKLQGILDGQVDAGNVYRGEVTRVMQLPEGVAGDWIESGKIHNDGFWSTTSAPEEMAKTTEGKLRGNTQIHISDADAVPVSKYSKVGAEKEAIIPPGRDFEITKVEEIDGVQHIWAKQTRAAEPVAEAAEAQFGNLKQVKSLLGHTKKLERLLAGDIGGADAAIELDALKRNWGKATKQAIRNMQNLEKTGDFAAEASRNTARSLSDTYETMRQNLMNEELWGKAGAAQKEINQGWQDWIDSRKIYSGTLMRQTGNEGSGEFGAWDTRARYEIDPNKVGGWIDQFGTGRGKLNDHYVQAHIDATDKLTAAIGKYVDTGTAGEHVAKVREAVQKIQTQLGVARETVAVANQVQLVGGAQLSGASKLAMAAAGGAVGGPIGAAAGAALGFIMSPAKTLQAAMTIQGLAAKVDAQKVGLISDFFQSAARKTASAAKAAGAAGEDAVYTESLNSSGALDTGKKVAKRAAIATAGHFMGGNTAQSQMAAYEKRRDQLAMLTTNPQLLAHQTQAVIGPLSGVAPQLASSFALDATRNLQMLQQMAPPASQIGGLFGGKRQTFTPQADIEKFAHQWDGVMNPLSVLKDLNNGSLNVDKVNAARAAHPELFADIAAEFLERAAKMKTPMNQQAALQADLLLGLNGAGEPSVAPAFLARIESLNQADQQDQRSPPQARPPTNIAKGTATLSQSLAGA